MLNRREVFRRLIITPAAVAAGRALPPAAVGMSIPFECLPAATVITGQRHLLEFFAYQTSGGSIGHCGTMFRCDDLPESVAVRIDQACNLDPEAPP